MRVEAVILGAGGYGGGELLRLLARHPHVAKLLPVSRSAAGKAVGTVHPHLHSLGNLPFSAEPDWASLTSVEPLVIFSAMKHGELAARFAALHSHLVELRKQRPVVLIDLSGDFRLKETASYEQHYGHVHSCPQLLTQFCYGLPELNREQLQKATLIANPGCFATAMSLAVLPLAKVPKLGVLVISGVTGSSGSGASHSETTHHPARSQDFRAYSPLAHRHLGEVEQVLQAAGGTKPTLSFVPHSGPFVRGIHVTVQCYLPDGLTPGDVSTLYTDQYSAEPFIRLVDRPPRVATVAGSNWAELAWVVSGRQLAVMCTLDNLGKGMAGQALQNMNLALGVEETTGLEQDAIYP